MALMLQRERLVKANRDRRARTYQHLQLRSSQTAIRTLSSCAAVAASRCQGDVVRRIQRIRRTFPHLHGGLSRPQTRPRIPAPGLAIRQPPTLPGGTCRTGNETHTHTRLTAVCPGLPGCAGTRKVKPIWILLKQETVSVQWRN